MILASDVFKVTTSDLKCKSPKADNHIVEGHIAVGNVVDLFILLLPVWLACTNMLRSKRMIQVILVFCVGILAVGLGIVRLTLILTVDFTVDTYIILRGMLCCPALSISCFWPI